MREFERADWTAAVSSLAGEERRAMAFLREHLPPSDLYGYPAGLFLKFARHAVFLRRTAPWCGALDWPVFAHYVLFPRVNDEDLSFHRQTFFDALWPRVKDLPGSEARIQEVNRWCRECATYQAQDERTASPLTVYRCGSGRCGEESAFLVSALRSVGVPARQVYAPRWSHCDDNHAWVEALCDGQWRFLGACEPEPVLDQGWFTTSASRAVLIHSRVFGGAEGLTGEEVLGTRDGVTWLNQTARYGDARRRTFWAEADGSPCPGAEFHLQILNEAASRTIAVLTADEQGTAQAMLGKGTVHVTARLGKLWAEGDCGPEGITLALKPPAEGDAPWTDFDFHAPAESRPAPAVLSREDKAQRAEVRRQADELRQARFGMCSVPVRPDWGDLRQKARGNWGELEQFLNRAGGADRERLVRTLSDKDFRDMTCAVLEDHFTYLPPRKPDVPKEIYWAYTACPRMGLERIAPWRGPLSRWLRDRTDDPTQLWHELRGLLTDSPDNCHRLWWTPQAALEAGACDEKSRRLLWVAALRTLGIPARLRPLDGVPEYWTAGGFRPVLPEGTGTLRLTCPNGDPPAAGRDWSLSRWTGEGWRRLSPAENWTDGVLTLVLAQGRYRLITTVRLPSGDQLASRREVELRAGEARTLPLRFRPWTAADLLTRQTLPAFSAWTLEGTEIPDLFRLGTGLVIALWLEEGAEPTEHVLNELLARREAASLPLLFLVRGRDSLSQPTLARAVEELPGARVLLDDWDYDLEAAARHLGRDPDATPLVVLCNGAGTALYSASGYRVGEVDLLLRAAGCAADILEDIPPDPLTKYWKTR